MKIGISTASYFGKLQIEDAILDIGAHHVPICELFLNSFSEYEPEFIELLYERVHRAGVTVFSIHPMSMQFEPQLFSIHPRQRGDAWRLYETVLRGGKRLGASYYVMHGPAHLSGTAKNIDLERIAPIFADLSALAREYGIQLTLENVSWCVFHEPEYGARLLEKIGPETIGFTLDVKQSLRSGFDPVAFVDTVGDSIRNVHLCDATELGGGAVRYEMPGYGGYDFPALFRALGAHGYAGPAFIEVYSDMYSEIPQLYESLARVNGIVHS